MNYKEFYEQMSINIDDFNMYRVYDGRNNQELGCFLDAEDAYVYYKELLDGDYDKMPHIEIYNINGPLIKVKAKNKWDYGYSATCSGIGTDYFNTLDECWNYIGKGSVGSLYEIRYVIDGELVPDTVPF